MKTNILIAHGFLSIPAAGSTGSIDRDADGQRVRLATVLANMASLGFAPSMAALQRLSVLNADDLVAFWRDVEPALRLASGDSRQMAKHVVYKNFPTEVLSMSQGNYWFNQILMYLGAPSSWLTQEAAERPMLDEQLRLKVLDLAPDDVLARISASLKGVRARWTDDQRDHAVWLARQSVIDGNNECVFLSEFGFKENGVVLIAKTIDISGEVDITSATDVLRLAVALSADAGVSGSSAGGSKNTNDLSLRGAIHFSRFGRDVRRFLAVLMESCLHLEDDFAARPALFKRLLRSLHPGDFNVPRLHAAHDALFNGKLKGFGSRLEALLHAGDPAALDLVATRPGEFVRRLHKLCALYGEPAALAFLKVADKLTTSQLLKIRSYVSTADARQTFIHPPRGNWTKAKFVANAKQPLGQSVSDLLKNGIDVVLAARLALAFPQGVDLDADVARVKLQTSDQELAPYGRGTRFAMPSFVRFVRTASYWRSPGATVWFDNGVSFFDGSWGPMGTLCWNATSFEGAAFSGDPMSGKTVTGEACQMIDLDLPTLVAHGVKYAVWSVLCFSKKAFGEAEDVCAALQWGEDPLAGGLFEPARAQMVFPLRGQSLVKTVAYLDLDERELVYMDANLAADVSSASNNLGKLSEQMPAFLDYLNAQPSVADLFSNAAKGNIPVLFSDEGRSLDAGQPAYVFQRRNAANAPAPIDLVPLLAGR